MKDNITIRDDLFTEVEITLQFVRKHISKHLEISGKAQHEEIWEYPLEVIREIVINMIVHRDYRACSDSAIKIFNDKIEFFNPGGLLKGITLNDILSGYNSINASK